MESNVAVHLADGFEEIEAVSIIDVLRRAGIDTVTVSITGKFEVTGAHGIKIKADKLFEEVNFDKTGMIVLPGGMPGAKNLKTHSGLRDQIQKFNNSGKPLGAICAAPMVFGDLGILKNKTATCFPGFESQLTGADVTGAEVEVSGNVITGKGPGVAIKFALEIVKTLKGESLAAQLAEDLIMT
ncbi:MAG: DJ-1/PfpI family protein [Prolixibacteraceae bacterium]|nr:DJ-1/PfpI family protein [Prolixibacteraceae bacterium]